MEIMLIITVLFGSFCGALTGGALYEYIQDRRTENNLGAFEDTSDYAPRHSTLR
jgi:hypothetical protein